MESGEKIPFFHLSIYTKNDFRWQLCIPTFLFLSSNCPDICALTSIMDLNCNVVLGDQPPSFYSVSLGLLNV